MLTHFPYLKMFNGYSLIVLLKKNQILLLTYSLIQLSTRYLIAVFCFYFKYYLLKCIIVLENVDEL